MGLPFETCRLIFLHLSLADLSACMQVCKELRSFIDTCSFWKDYLERNYTFVLRMPPKWSALYEWKQHTRCLTVSVTSSPDDDTETSEPYVFRPFPHVWRCGIVVPYGVTPPEGNLHVCHNFLQAMHWLNRLRLKIKQLKLRRQLNIEPCLIPWEKDRMPTPMEVLDRFNAHIEIIRSAYDAKTLTRQELQSYYVLLCGRDKCAAFSEKLYMWFVNNARNANLIFRCSSHVVNPTPSFLLTHLSSGWVGGVVFAI